MRNRGPGQAGPLVRFPGWSRSPVNALLLPAERDVFVQLAIHADARTGEAWPSTRTMARNTRRARSTVELAEDALAAFGLIALTGRLRREGMRGRRPLIWRINPLHGRGGRGRPPRGAGIPGRRPDQEGAGIWPSHTAK